jgi:hypothetical protein
MPNKDEENTDLGTDKWITVGGKKMKIPAGEEGDEALKEKLPSASGSKQSNTKEAQKSYTQRYGVTRTLFKTRDLVLFKEFTKEGLVSGLAGDNLTIMSDGRVYKSHKDKAFLKSELLGEAHWDTLTKADRTKLLEKAKVSTDYNTTNWANLSKELRDVLKENAPQGMTTATTGVHNPIYNPINEEIPVSQRIKDEVKRQHNIPSHEEYENGKDDTDEKKGKD